MTEYRNSPSRPHGLSERMARFKPAAELEAGGRQGAVQRNGTAGPKRRSPARHGPWKGGCRGDQCGRTPRAAAPAGAAATARRFHGKPLCRGAGPHARALSRPRHRAVIGWLLDTNVIAEIINPTGSRAVKAWAAAQPESRLFLSILTFGEYDKGIHHVPDDYPARPRFIAARDRLAARFAGRILSLTDPIVRRWGEISGTV